MEKRPTSYFNPYNLLGVSQGSSEEEIKKAYKMQALINHPDKGGDEEIMKLINNAYKILTKEKDKFDLNYHEEDDEGQGQVFSKVSGFLAGEHKLSDNFRELIKDSLADPAKNQVNDNLEILEKLIQQGLKKNDKLLKELEQISKCSICQSIVVNNLHIGQQDKILQKLLIKEETNMQTQEILEEIFNISKTESIPLKEISDMELFYEASIALGQCQKMFRMLFYNIFKQKDSCLYKQKYASYRKIFLKSLVENPNKSMDDYVLIKALSHFIIYNEETLNLDIQKLDDEYRKKSIEYIKAELPKSLYS